MSGSLNIEAFKELEPLYDEAATFAVTKPTVSISSLQRRFRIGYIRAQRLIERLAEQGVLTFNNMTGVYRRAQEAPQQA